jgi:osmotically-inducible protein OsmY
VKTAETIKNNVEQELRWEPSVCATKIGVSVNEDIASAAANHLNWNSQVPDTIKLKVSNGWITLQGTAEWQYQKEEAARAVRSLRGVKAVSNELGICLTQVTPRCSMRS